MSWPHEDWGWVAWMVMSLGMVAFTAPMIWLFLTIARTSRKSAIPPASTAEEILAGRLANGEIDDEYGRRLDTLHDSAGTSKVRAQ